MSRPSPFPSQAFWNEPVAEADHVPGVTVVGEVPNPLAFVQAGWKISADGVTLVPPGTISMAVDELWDWEAYLAEGIRSGDFAVVTKGENVIGYTDPPPTVDVVQPWVVLRTAPQYLDDYDREQGVNANPEWFDCFRAGDVNAGGCGAFKLAMVQQWLIGEGLMRVERTADDHESIVEWWLPPA